MKYAKDSITKVQQHHPDMFVYVVYNVFMDDNTEWPGSNWTRPKYISW